MVLESWSARAPRLAPASESSQALQLVLVRASVPVCGPVRVGELVLADASIPASRPAQQSRVAKVCESAAAFRLAQPSLTSGF
jgi:hypothetical protein